VLTLEGLGHWTVFLYGNWKEKLKIDMARSVKAKYHQKCE
jgi:hypothetical protein